MKVPEISSVAASGPVSGSKPEKDEGRAGHSGAGSQTSRPANRGDEISLLNHELHEIFQSVKGATGGSSEWSQLLHRIKPLVDSAKIDSDPLSESHFATAYQQLGEELEALASANPESEMPAQLEEAMKILRQRAGIDNGDTVDIPQGSPTGPTGTSTEPEPTGTSTGPTVPPDPAAGAEAPPDITEESASVLLLNVNLTLSSTSISITGESRDKLLTAL